MRFLLLFILTNLLVGQSFGQLADPGKTSSKLPKSVSLKHYCPYPKNQGRIPSSVGWAVGYGAFTIEMAKKHQWNKQPKGRQFITNWAFSGLFLYNQITGQDCEVSGAKVSDALESLKSDGVCLSKSFDEDADNCNRDPKSEHLEEASQFKISDFSRLFITDDGDDHKVDQTKTALSQEKPVVVKLTINKHFQTLDNNANFWWPHIGDQTPVPDQTVCVVGYDDNYKNSGGAFLVLNSWGKKWGKDGFIWMRYDVFSKYAKYGYTLELDESLAAANFWEDKE